MIRYEVLVNGQRRCVAGIESAGLLSVALNLSVRHDSPRPVEKGGFLSVGGIQDRTVSRHIRWTQGEVKVGDEVTIRVLGPGEFDEPEAGPDVEYFPPEARPRRLGEFRIGDRVAVHDEVYAPEGFMGMVLGVDEANTHGPMVWVCPESECEKSMPAVHWYAAEWLTLNEPARQEPKEIDNPEL